MSKQKTVHDMDKLSKAVVGCLETMAKNGTKATVETVVKELADSLSLAPTTLAALLKQLVDGNMLGGFYLRRGQGFTHDSVVPRAATKAKKKVAKKAKKATKKAVISPALLAKEIDEQERLAAEEEFRKDRRAHWRSKLGMAG